VIAVADCNGLRRNEIAVINPAELAVAQTIDAAAGVHSGVAGDRRGVVEGERATVDEVDSTTEALVRKRGNEGPVIADRG
jgi:hypothetical protein